jgi:hypothetical protein
MTNEEKLTGITYEDAMQAAEESAAGGVGTVEFEGRRERVVGLQSKQGMDEVPSARLTLDLEDGYLTLVGYFSRDDELIETSRGHPFG